MGRVKCGILLLALVVTGHALPLAIEREGATSVLTPEEVFLQEKTSTGEPVTLGITAATTVVYGTNAILSYVRKRRAQRVLTKMEDIEAEFARQRAGNCVDMRGVYNTVSLFTASSKIFLSSAVLRMDEDDQVRSKYNSVQAETEALLGQVKELVLSGVAWACWNSDDFEKQTDESIDRIKSDIKAREAEIRENTQNAVLSALGTFSLAARPAGIGLTRLTEGAMLRTKQSMARLAQRAAITTAQHLSLKAAMMGASEIDPTEKSLRELIEERSLDESVPAIMHVLSENPIETIVTILGSVKSTMELGHKLAGIFEDVLSTVLLLNALKSLGSTIYGMVTDGAKHGAMESRAVQNLDMFSRLNSYKQCLIVNDVFALTKAMRSHIKSLEGRNDVAEAPAGSAANALVGALSTIYSEGDGRVVFSALTKPTTRATLTKLLGDRAASFYKQLAFEAGVAPISDFAVTYTPEEGAALRAMGYELVSFDGLGVNSVDDGRMLWLCRGCFGKAVLSQSLYLEDVSVSENESEAIEIAKKDASCVTAGALATTLKLGGGVKLHYCTVPKSTEGYSFLYDVHYTRWLYGSWFRPEILAEYGVEGVRAVGATGETETALRGLAPGKLNPLMGVFAPLHMLAAVPMYMILKVGAKVYDHKMEVDGLMDSLSTASSGDVRNQFITSSTGHKAEEEYTRAYNALEIQNEHLFRTVPTYKSHLMRLGLQPRDVSLSAPSDDIDPVLTDVARGYHPVLGLSIHWVSSSDARALRKMGWRLAYVQEVSEETEHKYGDNASARLGNFMGRLEIWVMRATDYEPSDESRFQDFDNMDEHDPRMPKVTQGMKGLQLWKNGARTAGFQAPLYNQDPLRFAEQYINVDQKNEDKVNGLLDLMEDGVLLDDIAFCRPGSPQCAALDLTPGYLRVGQYEYTPKVNKGVSVSGITVVVYYSFSGGAAEKAEEVSLSSNVEASYEEWRHAALTTLCDMQMCKWRPEPSSLSSRNELKSSTKFEIRPWAVDGWTSLSLLMRCHAPVKALGTMMGYEPEVFEDSSDDETFPTIRDLFTAPTSYNEDMQEAAGEKPPITLEQLRMLGWGTRTLNERSMFKLLAHGCASRFYIPVRFTADASNPTCKRGIKMEDGELLEVCDDVQMTPMRDVYVVEVTIGPKEDIAKNPPREQVETAAENDWMVLPSQVEQSINYEANSLFNILVGIQEQGSRKELASMVYGKAYVSGNIPSLRKMQQEYLASVANSNQLTMRVWVQIDDSQSRNRGDVESECERFGLLNHHTSEDIGLEADDDSPF